MPISQAQSHRKRRNRTSKVMSTIPASANPPLPRYGGKGEDIMATIDSEAPVVSVAYHQRIEDVVAALGTDALHGLTDLEARTRLLRDGRNELAKRDRSPPSICPHDCPYDAPKARLQSQQQPRRSTKEKWKSVKDLRGKSKKSERPISVYQPPPSASRPPHRDERAKYTTANYLRGSHCPHFCP